MILEIEANRVVEVGHRAVEVVLRQVEVPARVSQPGVARQQIDRRRHIRDRSRKELRLGIDRGPLEISIGNVGTLRDQLIQHVDRLIELTLFDQQIDLFQHLLRARGAENFTLPFPDPNKPLRRPFDSPGRVELTSGAGYYWTAAELFVDDHPYYTATDREGRFTLTQVPPGKYELVCHVPNWHVVRTDRDPQTGLISRLQFGEPVQKHTSVELAPKGSAETSFRFGTTDFPKQSTAE